MHNKPVAAAFQWRCCSRSRTCATRGSCVHYASMLSPHQHFFLNKIVNFRIIQLFLPLHIFSIAVFSLACPHSVWIAWVLSAPSRFLSFLPPHLAMQNLDVRTSNFQSLLLLIRSREMRRTLRVELVLCFGRSIIRMPLRPPDELP